MTESKYVYLNGQTFPVTIESGIYYVDSYLNANAFNYRCATDSEIISLNLKFSHWISVKGECLEIIRIS